MNKARKILWGLLILALILTLPGIANRFQVEWNNQTYEIVVPYKDIQDIVRRDINLEKDDVLNRLKEAGLQAVSLEPDGLRQLEKKGFVTNLTFEDLRALSLFDPELKELIAAKPLDGLAVVIHEETELTNRIAEAFPQKEEITYEGRDMVLIAGVERKLLDQPLGFAPEEIETIRDADLRLVLRLPNEDLSEDQFLLDQTLTLSDENTDRILFQGSEVLGFGRDKPVIKPYTELLRDNGYGVYAIEFEEQKGFNKVAHTMYMDLIRLHSLPKGIQHDVAVDRAVRAVKERNIRSLFVNLHLKDEMPTKETLEGAETLLRDIVDRMPGMFHLGKAEPFESYQVPIWSQAAALLAAILFVSIAVLEVLKRQRLFYLSLAGLALIGLAQLATGSTTLAQGLALIVALVTPVFAIIPEKGKEERSLIMTYGRAILLSLIGIMIVVGILNGNEYLVNVVGFRGVLLTYIFPIAFMFLYAIWGNARNLSKMAVRYWHLIVIVAIAGVVFYYILRTGNAGTVSAYELMFRQKLEEWLYVRPRTKEFLIGFPFYILGLYLMRTYKRAALFLLVPGVIGFLSIVNTFTHLHIPLYVSILRTAYGLVLGLIVGYIFIFIYKQAVKLYKQQIKPRWLS